MGYEELVQRAVRRGTDFLLMQQDDDGFWRDYELKPGAAEGWTTAWVGWLLTRLPARRCSAAHLRRGCKALLASRTEKGWGYNRATGPDADSTAWALRFLFPFGVVSRRDAGELLGQFMDTCGRTHTFAELDAGDWGRSHPDVTPVVGLALVVIGGESTVIDQIRRAVIADQQPDGSWSSYWWQGNAYATARSLEFLTAAGGIPKEVDEAAGEWLEATVGNSSPLECAWLIEIAIRLGEARAAFLTPLLARVLSSQEDDGGWPPCAHLLVPPRKEGDTSHPLGPFADIRRCVSTANIIGGLSRWATVAAARPALLVRY